MSTKTCLIQGYGMSQRCGFRRLPIRHFSPIVGTQWRIKFVLVLSETVLVLVEYENAVISRLLSGEVPVIREKC
jgi:hypothetical protein